jgi:tRNA-2-methylthio-N6-dimethylallyladenosine synthase
MSYKSFLIKTFGCQMNDRDSEIMAQLLGEAGYVETSETAQADLVILNTCSIRAKAEQKVMSLLGVLRKHKKRNPEMKICVAGCVAQQEGRELIRRMGHVDLVIGTQNIYEIVPLLDSLKNKPVATTLVDDYSIPAFIPNLRSNPSSSASSPTVFRKFLTIMQGCNNYCSYCVVPHTRGREISRTVKHIIDEARSIVEAGVKEITLLGQNVNSYGQTNKVTEDGSDYTFANLLREVAKIDGLKRLRFTTSNPKDLSDDLMSCFTEIDILCPHFHLPVQSGSNTVLSAMHRRYTRELYLEKVAALRSYCPDIALTTDVIVGFPGETEEDFEDTMSLLEEVQYHGSYSFKYSDRPGTRSKDFSDKIDEDTKSKRLARFQKRQDAICLLHNQKYVGKTLPVMIEKNEHNKMVGRSDSNHLVHFKDLGSCVVAGDIIQAKIVHAGQHSLQGESKLTNDRQ